MTDEKDQEAALREAKRAAADPNNKLIPWEEAKAWLRRMEQRDDSSENKQAFVNPHDDSGQVKFE